MLREQPDQITWFEWISIHLLVVYVLLSSLVGTQCEPGMQMGFTKLRFQIFHERVQCPLLSIHPGVKQVDGVLALASEYKTERCGTSSFMYGGIVDKSQIRQHGVPIPWIVRTILRHHIGQYPVMSFNLSIFLWMVGRGSRFFDAQQLAHIRKELATKIRSLVGM